MNMLRVSVVSVFMWLTILPAIMQDANMTPKAASVGQIAFATDRDGNYEIYVMNADGTNQRRLTNDPDYNIQPSWSPDGTQVAFYSGHEGKYSLDIIDADGTQQRQLADDVEINSRGPSWSPDGMQLTFMAEREGHHNIYVIRSDGTQEHQLTKGEDFDNPVWSPDGASIAVRSYEDGIYVMNADGTDLRLVASTDVGEFEPVWSPDSQQITFVAGAGDGAWIYMVNVDGTDLYLWNKASESPAWSSDGTQIVFEYYVDSYDIYLKNADGTEFRGLANDKATDQSPAWSPDGQQIVFASNRDGDFNIYIINVDGTNLQRLTLGESSHNIDPVWQPFPLASSTAQP